MSFNEHGIWLGKTECLTTRGWEFSVHLFGGGYGIGFHDERIYGSRDEAVLAACDELTERLKRKCSYFNSKSESARIDRCAMEAMAA